METAVMARKITKSEVRASLKAKAARDKASAIAVTLRGSPAWKAWVEALAVHCRTDVAKLIDRGLILVARAEGYDKEAPER
jgi:hypothetical protein